MDVRINDEPVLDDCIGHYELVVHVLQTLVRCDPPYVIGVSGSWGAGKTSFLRKIWSLMGADFEVEQRISNLPLSKQKLLKCQKMCGDDGVYNQLRDEWWGRLTTKQQNDMTRRGKDHHGFDGWEVVWFNPWQHQFEPNPMVALLHEIRAQFSVMQKSRQSAGKLTNIAAYAVLDTICGAAEKWSMGLLSKDSADKIEKRGAQYEAKHFDTPLTSQSFRSFFEEAINLIVKPGGRLLICIDDLDRCEGNTAYQLLESLKLYLNACNCVFVIGMDQVHLEQNVSKALSSDKDDRRSAREYLDKLLQDRFVLPVPTNMRKYIEEVLSRRQQHAPFCDLFRERQEAGILRMSDKEVVITTLNENLPHNPRKIKLFLAGWERYLRILQQQKSAWLDWEITVVLAYLSVFEEPLYRQLELDQYFISAIIEFTAGKSKHELLDGFVLPSIEGNAEDETQEDEGRQQPSGDLESSGEAASLDDAPQDVRLLEIGEVFWIGRLIVSLKGKLDGVAVAHHLLDSKVRDEF